MTQQVDDDRIHRELADHPAKNGLIFNVAVTVLEVGGTLALFRVAKNAGAGNVAAYLIGSIAPILGALVVWARSKKFSGASAAIFAFAVCLRLLRWWAARTRRCCSTRIARPPA